MSSPQCDRHHILRCSSVKLLPLLSSSRDPTVSFFCSYIAKGQEKVLVPSEAALWTSGLWLLEVVWVRETLAFRTLVSQDNITAVQQLRDLLLLWAANISHVGESLLEQHKHKSIPGWPLLCSHSPLPLDPNTPTAPLNQNLIFSSLLLSISATKRHSCKVSCVTCLQPTVNNPTATTLSAGQLWLKL